MKEQNVILEKTFQFGLRIIKLHLYLKKLVLTEPYLSSCFEAEHRSAQMQKKRWAVHQKKILNKNSGLATEKLEKQDIGFACLRKAVYLKQNLPNQ